MDGRGGAKEGPVSGWGASSLIFSNRNANAATGSGQMAAAAESAGFRHFEGI